MGKTVTTRFVGLNNLTVVDYELDHGVKLSYQKFRITEESTIRERIKSKEDLNVFAPKWPMEGPGYTLKEIMDEARKLLE